MTEAEWIAFFRRPEIPAFNAAMLADPDNDLPRLVFADWVEENCPHTPFVMALRRSIANPRTPEWVPNFSMVVKGHELRLWRGRLEVGIDPEDPEYDPAGDDFLRAASDSCWVGRLKFRGMRRSFAPTGPAFRPSSTEYVEWFDFFDSGVSWGLLARIVSQWPLPRLTGVDLRLNQVGESEARVIADTPAFGRLRILLLEHSALTATCRQHLAESRYLPEHIRAQFRRPA